MSTVSSDQSRLERMLQSQHACIHIITAEEAHATEMVHAAAMGMKQQIWAWSVVKGIYPSLIEGSKSITETENPAAALVFFKQQLAEPSICVMYDLACHLDDERTLRCLRELIHTFRETGSTLVMIDHHETLPPVIAAEATAIELSLPDSAELERLIRATLRKLKQKNPRVEAKLTKGELQTILRNLRGLTRRQAEQIIIDTVSDDHQLNGDDVNTILAHKRRLIQNDGALEYIESPVNLHEIGGLRTLKKWLEHRRNSLTDDAAEFGVSAPRGVLLLGVQGAGKSLSAKAIATAWQRPLLRLDPGTLYDRFIGESERRLRNALHQAEMMSPIILWIDEIEKGFASAASRSVDGGLSQRMFGSLLTWMQEHTAPVFLIATANDIDALPPELLRKGRFDEVFFVDLPPKDVRKEFDLHSLASASDGFSGAEIEQAIVAALHEAFAEKSEINTARILSVLERSPPLSVTMAERIQSLREWAQGRCVPAD
jgi:hypothetical protein